MHDKDTKSLTYILPAVIHAPNSTEMVTQIVSNCSNAGTGSWVLRILDKFTPSAHTWYGPITLAVSSGGPMGIQFLSPIRFSDGILINTSGNAGVLDLSVSVLNTQGL
jgi:hypothetical protein